MGPNCPRGGVVYIKSFYSYRGKDGTKNFVKPFFRSVPVGEVSIDEYDIAINEIHDKFADDFSNMLNFARHEAYYNASGGLPEFSMVVEFNRGKNESEVAFNFVGRQIPKDILTTMLLGTTGIKVLEDEAKEIMERAQTRVAEFLNR